MHDTELHAGLRHLFAEPDFASLRARQDAFDPFKVLKVERYELRHTTTLAWLLEPGQTHGLGDDFLRHFLREACGAGLAPAGQVAVQAELRLGDGQLHAPVTEADADQADDTVAPRARRTGELDVLVESEHWALAIEAKIDSQEGQAQLLDYGRYLARRFDGRKVLTMLYLTVDAEPDTVDANPGWHGIQWGAHVARALRTALSERYGSVPGQALPDCAAPQRALCEFLHRYLHLLERLDGARHGDHAVLRALADRHRRTLAALKAALRQREDDGAPVLPWSASPGWAADYWRQRQLLDALVGSLRSPEAGFAAALLARLDTARNMPLQRLDSDGGKRATFRFVPLAWMGWHLQHEGRKVPLHTLLFYHVALRTFKQDVEIKLLLPNSADHALQASLVQALLARQQARGGTSLEPDPGHLGAFLAPTGGSLKLYSEKIGWRLDDSGRSLHAGADQRIAAFWKAAAEHSALLEEVLAQGD